MRLRDTPRFVHVGTYVYVPYQSAGQVATANCLPASVVVVDSWLLPVVVVHTRAHQNSMACQSLCCPAVFNMMPREAIDAADCFDSRANAPPDWFLQGRTTHATLLAVSIIQGMCTKCMARCAAVCRVCLIRTSHRQQQLGHRSHLNWPVMAQTAAALLSSAPQALRKQHIQSHHWIWVWWAAGAAVRVGRWWRW